MLIREKLSTENLERLSIQEFKNSTKNPVILVLDNVRSLHNVGSVFRTSDAFCIEQIFLCGITGTPPHREIQKTALGATESVSWQYFQHTSDAIQQLISQQYTIYAVEQTKNSQLLEHTLFNNHQKYALVFGNEVQGVDQSIINQCHSSIEIPQFGTKHSFNLSVSVGIILWHYYICIKS